MLVSPVLAQKLATFVDSASYTFRVTYVVETLQTATFKREGEETSGDGTANVVQ